MSGLIAAAECCVARFVITYKWGILLKLFSGYPLVVHFLVKKYFRYVFFQILQYVGGITVYFTGYIIYSGDYQVINTNS